MRPEALIFDVDGTLAETEEVHRHAFNDAFAAAGLDWTWDRALYARLLGVAGGKERLRAWCDEIGSDLDDAALRALHEDKTARYTAAVEAGAVELRPGVRALIEAARSAGVPLAVATTTTLANVDALTRAAFGAPCSEIFAVVAAGDDAPAKKPDPLVYTIALQRLGLPAASCVAFEDSANGVRAALAAGIPCIVTPGIYTAGEDFSGATVLESLDGVRLDDLAALAATA